MGRRNGWKLKGGGGFWGDGEKVANWDEIES